MHTQDKQVKVGQIWQHFKGTDYQILDVSRPVPEDFSLKEHLIVTSFNAILEASQKPCTVYKVIIAKPKPNLLERVKAFLKQERSHQQELVTIVRIANGDFVDVPMVFYTEAYSTKTHENSLIWGRTLDNFLEICGCGETCFYNRFEYKYSF